MSWRKDQVWSVLIFLSALGVLSAVTLLADPEPHLWASRIFFFLFGLFTIAVGFPHPGIGHVSFDRVAQVSAILVLGPIEAAWICGLASIVYPWHRLAKGESVDMVVTASLHNAGLMSMMVLGGGLLYVSLGGPIPLISLDWQVAGLLLLLLVVMEVINDLGIIILIRTRNGDWHRLLNGFALAVEISSGLAAILVASFFNRNEPVIFTLLLIVLGLGMLVLKQLADMRQQLELRVAKRTRELQEKSLELERQATHDRLTRLFNRRYAEIYLDREIENAHRYNHAFSVALMDIDHFKAVNDTYSHAKGDEVLKRVARIMQERCRKSDMLARYGGEEFLLCFPETDIRSAAVICDELREAVIDEDWSSIAPGIRISLSFGLARLGAGSSKDSVLNIADEHLYQAKNNGRNQVVS